MSLIPRLTMLLLLTLAWTLVPATPSQAANSAYVDPVLTLAQSETIAIIVTANDSRQAATAVTRLGGKVSSDLWLIDAVGAVLPTAKLAALTTSKGIQSIVANRQVEAGGSISGGDWLKTDAAWPVTVVDVGAEKVHAKSITGMGVTVAVIDSGVYFDPIKMMFSGSDSATQFLGQADFLGSEPCRAQDSFQKAMMEQGNGYCLQKHFSSSDSYEDEVSGNGCEPKWVALFSHRSPLATLLQNPL